MNIIKTYEGFFDLLKKNKKKVYTDSVEDIIDCLSDLTDEGRIFNQLNGDDLSMFNSFTRNSESAIFADRECVFPGTRFGGMVTPPEQFKDKIQMVEDAISFNLIYELKHISDEEVNKLLLDCKERLKAYDCKMTYFIGWGFGEGSSSDKEWDDFLKMIEKTIKKTYAPERARNITIKIKSNGKFDV